MWNPIDSGVNIMKYEDVQKMYFTKNLQIGYGKESCKLKDWFFDSDTVFYNITGDPFKPKVYIEGQNRYINLSPGFQYQDKASYLKKCVDLAYAKKMKNIIGKIWNHIKISWCSRDENQFEYAKSWLCSSVAGKKLLTAMYLKNAVEGCGGYNSAFVGKTLVVFDELPANTKNQWEMISESLKQYITEPTFAVKVLVQDSQLDVLPLVYVLGHTFQPFQ
eukprot:gene14537-17173_t